MTISVKGLAKSFGANTVLSNLDLTIKEQSFTVLCGPTGVGKSVLFRMLVGLEQPDAGTITLKGHDITHMPAAQRSVGYVPQSFALYPHLTVRANIGYPLKLAKRPASEIAKRVDWAAGVLAIADLLDKTPDQLSGGEKQRTAVARGLLKDSDVFILDDPLVGLDYKLRERLIDELKSIQQKLKATFLYATSDSLEALTMAEDLVVFDAGSVVQHDKVRTVYRVPEHHRAMELIGFPKSNLLPINRQGTKVMAGPFAIDGAPESASLAGLRPEAILVDSNTTGAKATGTVQLVEDLGAENIIYVDAGAHSLTIAKATNGSHVTPEGSAVTLSINPADLVFFDSQTGRRMADSARDHTADVV